MEFELEYQLSEFREIQDQYFDENNKCYTGVNLSPNTMESMLKLIDKLSERVNELEPVIKHQIKKSLPIHVVMDWVVAKDRLPHVYENVLACFEKESDGMKPIICTAYWCGDSWITDKHPILTNTIQYWKHLPKPPCA